MLCTLETTLGNCGFAVDVFCTREKSIAAEDTDEKIIVSMENHRYEGHSPSGKYSDVEDLQLAASAEFGKKLLEVEFDLEDDCETAKCKNEALNSSSIKSPASSQMTGQGGGESKMKSPPERNDNVGSVNKEQIEDYLELHHATPSEGGNVLEQFGNYMMMGGFDMSSEYTDVHQRPIIENVNLLYVSPMEYSGYSVEQLQKSDDNNCVISQDAATCLDTSLGAKGPLNEVERRDLDAHKIVVEGKLICVAK